MNRMMRIVYAGLLCLLLAAGVYALPQQDEPKSREDAAKAQQGPEAKPEGTEKQEPEKQENAKPEKSDKEREAGQDKNEDKKEKEANPKSEKDEREAGSAREMNGQGRDAHPAGKSARIPDDKFRASFGKQHHFSIGHRTTINNRPGFQYGGYSFVIVDAWPADWAYTDDCYVDYIDGEYFLFDLLHPGMRIALSVEM
jgi:hypothetical protein